MSKLRESLFNIIYDACNTGSPADRCTRIEDAIIAKFDIVEKKPPEPRYGVRQFTANLWDVVDTLPSAGFNGAPRHVATFRNQFQKPGDVAAREYADLLNKQTTNP